MTVILINEDNHGLIGVANNYFNAVSWLIDNHWIDDNTEVWNDASDQWEKLIDLQGEDWADRMRDEWDIDNFNYFWENSFSLNPIDIIGTDKE